MSQILSNKVALVSGGGKNLGGVISLDLAKAGAKIVIHYHSPSSKAEAEIAVAAIEAAGGQAKIVSGDLTKVSEVQRVFSEANDAFGGLDIAVNTVGQVLKKPILETTEQEFDQMFEVNNKAAYFFIQEAGRTLRDGGKIISVVTSLLAAFTGYYSVYAGSKAPVEHYTRAAAKEFGGRGISVNNVAPGPLDTPFFYPVESPEAVAYHKSASMNGQLGDIKDIAPIVRFLASEGWWITGQTLFANGGYTTR